MQRRSPPFNPYPPPPPSPSSSSSSSSSSNTPESGDSVYVLRLLRPLLGFVQIGLFASPELPISGRRHQRVEGRADVGRESPEGAGMKEGGRGRGRASALLGLIGDRSGILPPPAFFHPLPPFYVGVGAPGAPLLRQSPRLYKSPASRVPQPA